MFCCEISIEWIGLGLGSPQGLERLPARARIAMKPFYCEKGADLTTFWWEKNADFTKKKGADL